MNQRIYTSYLFDTSLGYFVSGIILTLSHHFHTQIVLVYLGHFMISVGLVTTIALAFNNRWRYRVFRPVEGLGSTSFLITFLYGVLIFLIEELGIYNSGNILTKLKTESLFLTVFFVIIAWLFFLYMAILIPLFKRKSKRKNKRLGIMIILVVAFTCLIEFFYVGSMKITIPIVITVMVIVAFIMNKDKLPNIRVTFLEISHALVIFIVCLLVSFLISLFTKAVSPIFFLIIASILLLLLIVILIYFKFWINVVIAQIDRITQAPRFYLLMLITHLAIYFIYLLVNLYKQLKNVVIRFIDWNKRFFMHGIRR